MHAPVWAGLATSGQMIGAHDLLIAATALVQGYNLDFHLLSAYSSGA